MADCYDWNLFPVSCDLPCIISNYSFDYILGPKSKNFTYGQGQTIRICGSLLDQSANYCSSGVYVFVNGDFLDYFRAGNTFCNDYSVDALYIGGFLRNGSNVIVLNTCPIVELPECPRTTVGYPLVANITAPQLSCSLSNPYISKTNPNIGEQVVACVNIRNTGNTTAWVHAEIGFIRPDGVTDYANSDSTDLAPNALSNFCIAYAPPKAGTYTVIANGVFETPMRETCGPITIGTLSVGGQLPLPPPPPVEKCPSGANKPECSTGQTQTQTCTDGSTIVIRQCVDGCWQETGNTCPGVPPPPPPLPPPHGECSTSDFVKQRDLVYECGGASACLNEYCQQTGKNWRLTVSKTPSNAEKYGATQPPARTCAEATAGWLAGIEKTRELCPKDNNWYWVTSPAQLEEIKPTKVGTIAAVALGAIGVLALGYAISKE